MGDNSENGEELDARSLEQWLQQFADSRDHSKEEVLQQLSASLWALDELENILSEAKLHGDIDATPQRATPGSTQPTEDSTQPEVREELSTLSERLESLEDDLESLAESYTAFSEDTSEDVDTIEEILRYLVEQTDSMSERVSNLEQQVSTHEQTITEWKQTQAELESLKQAANKAGVTEAACEHCESTIQIGLLTQPKCPVCSSNFADVNPKSGFFGSNTLTTKPKSSRSAINPRDNTTQTESDTAFTTDSTDPSAGFEMPVDVTSPPSDELKAEFGFNLDSKPSEPATADDSEESAGTTQSTPGEQQPEDEDEDETSFEWRSG